jgi:hypothetical protein
MNFEKTVFAFHCGFALTKDERSCEVSAVEYDIDTDKVGEDHKQRWFDPRDAEHRAEMHRLLDVFIDGIKGIPMKTED